MGAPTQRVDEGSRTSWLPLIIVMMCQIQISFNAFNVSIQGIVDDLGIPASSVGLALTTATFAMAGFVLLGTRLAARIGVRTALQLGMIGPTLAAIVISVTNRRLELVRGAGDLGRDHCARGAVADGDRSRTTRASRPARDRRGVISGR